MTADQAIVFSLLGVLFALLIWGRWRYDLVAFSTLIAGVLLGVVPVDQAFSGFSHHAVIIIALVLVASRGLTNSGAIDMIARIVIDSSRSLSAHIAILAGVGAAMSTLMNNVGALALLMPVDLRAAEKAGRSPSLTLMPLSFATILGGLVTLIGTPPNIIVASYRARAVGAPFGMFDFTPVGLAAAIAGVAFVTLVGWRLIPGARDRENVAGALSDLGDYIAELRVKKDSDIVGKRVSELDVFSEDAAVSVLGLVRRGARLQGSARNHDIRASDILVVEGGPKAIEELVGALDLKYAGSEKHENAITSADTGLMEVVVPQGARIEGRSAMSMHLLYRQGVTVLGISRQGRRFRERVRKLPIRAGDILLLYGPTERLPHVADWIGGIPIAERGLKVLRHAYAWPTVGIFLAAIAAAATGYVTLPVGLSVACIAMCLLNVVPMRELYDAIEWPVIVLLASLIPLGGALEQTGGTGLIAQGILWLSSGGPPIVVLTLLMVITMSLSDVMNNTATAVIAAPVAVDIATRLQVNADPFLMAVAVGASCAFLTPIGHKNNTLILGPGGYSFGDYWRMGLPLELIVIAVSVPMLALVWPF